MAYVYALSQDAKAMASIRCSLKNERNKSRVQVAGIIDTSTMSEVLVGEQLTLNCSYLTPYVLSESGDEIYRPTFPISEFVGYGTSYNDGLVIAVHTKKQAKKLRQALGLTGLLKLANDLMPFKLTTAQQQLCISGSGNTSKKFYDTDSVGRATVKTGDNTSKFVRAFDEPGTMYEITGSDCYAGVKFPGYVVATPKGWKVKDLKDWDFTQDDVTDGVADPSLTPYLVVARNPVGYTPNELEKYNSYIYWIPKSNIVDNNGTKTYLSDNSEEIRASRTNVATSTGRILYDVKGHLYLEAYFVTNSAYIVGNNGLYNANFSANDLNLVWLRASSNLGYDFIEMCQRGEKNWWLRNLGLELVQTGTNTATVETVDGTTTNESNKEAKPLLFGALAVAAAKVLKLF